MEQLISRQAAIDEANAWLLDCLKVNKQDRSCGLIRRLEDLPIAEPKRGKWIRFSEHGTCPYCGNCVDLVGGKENNFCSECGADLRGK